MKNERIKINNIDKASIRYLLFDSKDLVSFYKFSCAEFESGRKNQTYYVNIRVLLFDILIELFENIIFSNYTLI